MLLHALAGLLALSLSGAPQVQDPTTAADTPVRLEDVVVERGRLVDAAENFVDEIAGPANRRGLARWRGQVCVGVANLKPESAQYIADRVSTVAADIGLEVGAPGCRHNILVIAATDGPAFTEQFVAMRPRLFRVGGSGMDRGSAAFEAFKRSERPVRWWAVSAPVDSETGVIATRIPGYCEGACTSAVDYAPKVEVFAASRLNTQIRDDLLRLFVIVDVDKVQGVTLAQLADYIAMVSLAQIDAEADASQYQSILNVFGYPEDSPSLTGWDLAYLRGLYEGESQRINQAAQVNSVAEAIVRAYREGQVEAPSE